jgi:hypothetical protein
MRRLQELPIQGVPPTLKIRSWRWRCRNEQCARKTFAEVLAIAVGSVLKASGKARPQPGRSPIASI